MPVELESVKLCGRMLYLKDRVRVRYTTGRKMKDGVLSGVITKLWPNQAQVNNGWCFHDCDEIIELHREEDEKMEKIQRPLLDNCSCGNCTTVLHASDCALHNMPAKPNEYCDCGVTHWCSRCGQPFDGDEEPDGCRDPDCPEKIERNLSRSFVATATNVMGGHHERG